MNFRETPDSELGALYLGGMTRSAIADQFNVSEAQVRNRLENAGVFKRSRKAPLVTKEELEALIEQGLWEKEIAERLGCSDSHIRRIRRRYGILAKRPIKNKRPVGIEKWRLTSTQEEMLVGTLMGDSSVIPVNKHQTSWRFSCGHCEQQREYLEHKRDVLKPFSWGLRPQEKVLNGKLFKGFKMETYAHLEFGRFRQLFYPQGRKVFGNVVEMLTPRSLAFWMMDDGGRGGSFLVLGYHDLRGELCMIRDYIKQQFGITLRVSRQAEGFFKLCATTKKSKNQLASLVGPYFHSSMRYKIAKWLSDNPEPSLGGNPSEGATTRSSLTSQEYGDNDHLSGVIPSGSAAGPNSSAVGQDIVWSAQRCAEVGRNDQPQPVKGCVT